MFLFTFLAGILGYIQNLTISQKLSVIATADMITLIIAMSCLVILTIAIILITSGLTLYSFIKLIKKLFS